jgi:hypothetical protein
MKSITARNLSPHNLLCFRKSLRSYFLCPLATSIYFHGITAAIVASRSDSTSARKPFPVRSLRRCSITGDVAEQVDVRGARHHAILHGPGCMQLWIADPTARAGDDHPPAARPWFRTERLQREDGGSTGGSGKMEVARKTAQRSCGGATWPTRSHRWASGP